MTTGKLFSRKIPSLKHPADFTSILEGTAYIISQDDQVSAKKNRNLVSGEKNALRSAQRLQACYDQCLLENAWTRVKGMTM